ncbi:MAG: hypothetical protein V7K47_11365 [Nostoc sp.]
MIEKVMSTTGYANAPTANLVQKAIAPLNLIINRQYLRQTTPTHHI